MNEKDEMIFETIIEFAKMCPLCGKTTYIPMTIGQYERYCTEKINVRTIKSIFPEKDKAERKTLRTSLCQKCQRPIWASPIDSKDGD